MPTSSATPSHTPPSAPSPAATAPGNFSLWSHFRSIPYATIPARFKPSVQLSHIPEHFDHRPHRDFASWGSACPQIDADPEGWFATYGGPLGDEVPLHWDDLACTNLSVAVPRVALEQPGVRLPVMVYVHGGGLQVGRGHVDGLHSGCRTVAASMQHHMPVIMVNIGYRLNWFGFLTCQDLLDEARDEGRGEAGEVFNLGLHDQRRAFRWIKANIGGFGGDPGRITAFGESAGSISLTYHLCGSEPLFNRVILQSCGIWASSTLEQKEAFYKNILSTVGIEGKTGAERLAALRKVDAGVLSKIPGFSHVFPYLGRDTTMFDRGPPTYGNQFELVKTCPWIDALIVGADHFEGHILLPYFKKVDPAKCLDVIRAALGESELTERILNEYDLSIDVPQDLFWLNFSTFSGDIWLTEQIHTLADEVSKAGKPVHKYTFCLTNPWPGTDCSYATGHHFVEIFFQFLTCIERYPKHRDRFLERQAREFARRWIVFANGGEPWPKYLKDEGGTVAVCDDNQGWCERSREEDDRISSTDPWGKRRYQGVEMIRRLWQEMEKTEGTGNIDGQRKMLVNLKNFLS